MPNRFEDDHDLEAEILRAAAAIDAQRAPRMRDTLMKSAAELGISEEAVLEAERRVLAERSERSILHEFQTQYRRSFWGHFAAWTIINLFLVALNFVNWEGKFWAIMPILGWGIAIAFHAWAAFNPNSEEFQKDYVKWKLKRGIPLKPSEERMNLDD
jgi:hypothetical protein